MMQEYPITCPHCWQGITLLIDCSQKRQRYVEDCEVCCNPMDIRVRCRKGKVVELEAEILGQ
jgi:hypothetical protein